MTKYELDIAYNEGFDAFHDDVTNVLNNPYDGVSEVLAESWSDGYWDAWDGE
jgi:hypothetical protein